MLRVPIRVWFRSAAKNFESGRAADDPKPPVRRSKRPAGSARFFERSHLDFTRSFDRSGRFLLRGRRRVRPDDGSVGRLRVFISGVSKGGGDSIARAASLGPTFRPRKQRMIRRNRTCGFVPLDEGRRCGGGPENSPERGKIRSACKGGAGFAKAGRGRAANGPALEAAADGARFFARRTMQEDSQKEKREANLLPSR
ncbi:MAG TPA: hypothetical protein DCW71_07335 [Alistipes sp.]|nr:hypothetical protein [Alistipes sp.]